MIYIKVKQNGNWKNLLGPDNSIFKGYTILTPDMLSGTIGTSGQMYIGTATHLIIDDSFPVNSLDSLFMENNIITSLVILTNKFTNLENLFSWGGRQLKNIFINTSNVTSMFAMFSGTEATSLDLSSFDTSNVTRMDFMFSYSQATTLDLSSFDTSNITDMSNMFSGSQAPTLDLSSFDTSKVTNMNYMFYDSQATTGYARTQTDADRFNASSGKPAALNFIVKP